MAHVFISYSHFDADFATLLKIQLEKSGFNIWVDSERLRAGEDWRQGIDDAIRGAFAMLVVLTPEADQSKYVTYEWACAWGAGVRIIPLMLKPTHPHPRLAVLHNLDFSSHADRPWTRLVNELRHIEREYETRVYVPPDAPPNVRGALEALNNWDPEIRRRAAQVLSSQAQNHASVIPALLKMLRDDDGNVRETAVIALGNLGDPVVVPALNAILQAEVGDMRLFAITALGKINDAAVVPLLVNALYDNDRNVRYVAEEALSRLLEGDPAPEMIAAFQESGSRLMEALYDKDFDVRNAAAKTLGKVGGEAMVPQLIEILEHGNRQVGYAAAHALSTIGTPDALNAVERWQSMQKDASSVS